jgi:hypothetical protein
VKDGSEGKILEIPIRRDGTRMSIGTWHASFVHPDESYQAPMELYENAEKLLEQIGWVGMEFPEEGSVWTSFNPKDVDLPINALDAGRAGYVESYYCVWRFDKPTALELHGVQRYCKARKALVATKLRAQLKGILDELEGVVGNRFVMKKYASE